MKRRGVFASPFSHQLCVSLYCLLYPLRLDADVALCGACGTVLQDPLNKRNVIAVVLVNLRCVPLAEAVSAYAFIAKVVTDNCKLLLYCPLRDGEDSLVTLDGVSQTVVFYVLSNHKRDSENSALLQQDARPHPPHRQGPQRISQSAMQLKSRSERSGFFVRTRGVRGLFIFADMGRNDRENGAIFVNYSA